MSSLIWSPTRFHSNLDPANPNISSDPYAYGGFIKGSGCPDNEQLAVTNNPSNTNVYSSMQQPGPTREKFEFQTGAYTGGLNNFNVKTPSNDFSGIVDETTSPKKAAPVKYSSGPNTLEYTTPKELLPTPDMRQTLSRDPSDPSNFMYDRTLFAPLKKRNPNEADRFRGDLDIAPIKTGWFDIATNPSVDLTKGYFGYYNDITEYQDIQDIAYQRSRDESNEAVSQKLNTALSQVSKEITDLNPLYEPMLPMRLPVDNNNPWYNEKSETVARGFDM
jgi:hypothetical protein